MASVDTGAHQNRLAVSTGSMVLLLIFFFPAFPFAMIYRIVKHRDYPYKKISDCKLVATILLVFSVLGYIVTFGSGPLWREAAIVTVFLFIPSVWQYSKASKIKQAIYERCIQYRDYIYVNDIASITELANLTGQRPILVNNEVKHHINSGLLPDLETVGDRILRLDIDVNTSYSARSYKYIVQEETPSQVHCDHPSHSKTSAKKNSKSEAAPKPKPKTVQCHGCGASITIVEGETKKCEYCENTLS